MSRPVFPFAALVGLDTLRMGLQLAAIDHRLSVLVRGDKGAGKTTAARGLGKLLDEHAPFVNLPIGVTDDRLLGGLDIDRTLKGEPALRRGLLAEASGGVLYVDEVNLLPDHLADTLLDAVATGVHVVEREGFSAEQDAAFVLIGSMNPEEGALRPQLLDRFALTVDVTASMDPAMRREAVVRRLRFDEDPIAFCEAWQDEQSAMTQRVRAARSRVAKTTCAPEILDHISRVICEYRVASLRADLAVVRASRALAALDGRDEVTLDDVSLVLPLVLSHRARHGGEPRPPARPPASGENQSSASEDLRGSHEANEHVFAPRDVKAPQVVVSEASSTPGLSPAAQALNRGVVTGARQTAEPHELDLRASIVHAIGFQAPLRGVPYASAPQLRVEDLHEKRRAPQAGTRFIFVVDASGSHAAHQRMRLVKGAVTAVLDRSARRHDEVVVIAFRGVSASVVLEPTQVLEEAEAALAYLPTGGRTPLAHGLELAAHYVTDVSALILLTDGRANVPMRSSDAWVDAIAAASAIRCPALVIDSDVGPHGVGRTREIADAMRATYAALDGLADTDILRLVGRGGSAAPLIGRGGASAFANASAFAFPASADRSADKSAPPEK